METFNDDIVPIEDLEEFQNFEMSDSEIILMINDSLKYENWSTKDLAEGKKISIFPEWEKQMDRIVYEYREKGWKLYWFHDNGSQYLQFENPWRKKRL